MTTKKINQLADTIRTLFESYRGILAMDESNHTCNERFAAAGIVQNEESRREYLEMIITTPSLSEFIGSLAAELQDEKPIWKERFESIVNFEKHLSQNGTQIIKFFLHLSKEEQRKRFLERIEVPDKNWKFSLSDIHEREYWKHYVKAYEECLSATSAEHGI